MYHTGVCLFSKRTDCGTARACVYVHAKIVSVTINKRFTFFAGACVEIAVVVELCAVPCKKQNRSYGSLVLHG